MKSRIVFSTLLLLCGLAAYSQSKKIDETEDKKTLVEKPSRDFVMLKVFTCMWSGTPDSLKTKSVGRGFAGSISYDFPIQKSNFSFAAGVGINTQNIFLDGQTLNFKDTGSSIIVQNASAYKRYKYTTFTLEAPLELRYFSNNKNRNVGFKAAIGANVGLNLSGHTKGKLGSSGSKFSDKVVTKRFMEQWSFAPTIRLGYGNFSVYGSYGLTTIFKDGAGPTAYPTTIGICITGL